MAYFCHKFLGFFFFLNKYLSTERIQSLSAV